MIGNSVLKSAGLMAASQILAKTLDFVALLILARLLLPEHFGLVALATSVLMIASAVTELPASDALVQRGEVTEADVASAFTLTVLRGVVVSLALLLLATPMAILLKDARLEAILRVLAIAPLIQGFASPAMVLSLRKVNYAPLAVSQLLGKIFAFVAIVVTAKLTGSYWALVVGQVANAVISVLVTHIAAPYRFRMSLKGVVEILSFTTWVTLARAMFMLNQQ
ncbi:MAG: oligosaccharide flippase family protein, partial [Caulobacter sp.]